MGTVSKSAADHAVVRKAAESKARTGAGRGAGRKSPSSREAILRTTAKIYTNYGYDATTIRDIAAAQGLLPGSIYHYFGSKDALIQELYEQGIEHIIAAVVNASEGIEDPWARLEAVCVAHLETLATGSPYGRVIAKDVPMSSPALVKVLVAARDRYEKIFQRYIDALGFSSKKNARLFRLQLLGSLNATTRWYRKGGEWTPAEIARGFMRNLKRPKCTNS